MTIPITVGLGTMLLATHMSGMSAVFPSLVRELGSDAARGQWILTAYTLTLSGFLLMFGSIADRIGLKTVYIGGMAVFGIASGASALAPGAAMLIASRVLQGLGAAMVSATSVALIGRHVSPRHLGRALGWQTGLTYAGLAVGPALAGYLFENLGWRAVFAVNAPIAAAVIACALAIPAEGARFGRAIPRGQMRTHIVSGLAWAATLLSLMLALDARNPHAMAGLCAAGFAIVLFRPGAGPFHQLRIFRVAGFADATVAEAVYYFCLHAIGFLIPLYLAQGRLAGAVRIGIFLAAQNGARAVAAPLSGRLCDRFGPRALTSAATLLLIVAACGMVSLDPETPSWKIFAVLMVLGAGGGLFAPANSRALLGTVSRDCYGLATGVLATARNLGMAFGAGTAALLYFEFGGRPSALATLQAVRPSFAVIACSAILYAIRAAQLHSRRNEPRARLAQPVNP